LPEVLSSVYVKSIRLGSSDVLAEGLHLTTTAPEARLQIVLAKGIKLEGSVSDDRQSPARNVKVALVPDFPNRNRIDLYRSATTDGSGKFRMQAIPPGDYKIYAWEDIVDGAWQDQEVLRAYDSRGRAIRIEDGRAATVEITVIR
jgi:hypothetical protein